jgi:ELWxxDGT repeat protein
MLVKDVWPGQESGAAGNFTKLINKLVFIGNDGVSGYKTWQSDGTQSGTKVATGIADPGNGTLQELVETGVKIYASIDESGTGTELWGVSYSTVLPLIWIDFTAKLVKNDALLNWTTSNEINTSEFIIERSVNGHDFEMVGRVAANGRAGVQQYQFTDAGITSLNKDIVYYRVKQTDIDSRASYSSVVSIEMKQKMSLRLYPNPASQFISVDGSSLKGRVEFKVFDNSGKLVNKGAENVSGNLAIDISKLSAGGYYLDIRSDAINKQIQFVKN